jgi:hypothetical protein
MNDTPHGEKPTTSPFDVVMLKRTANEQTCTPDDLKRVRVMAADQMNAIWAPEVVAEEKEYRVLGAVGPGHETEIEMAARSRAYNGGETDRAKIGFGDHVPVLPANDK